MAEVQTDWLKARKKALKVSDETISRAVGIERSVVTKIINAKVEFTPRYADGFARSLDLSREEVLFRFGVLEENPQPVADVLDGAEPAVAIPILGEVPAGPWREEVRSPRGWEHVARSEVTSNSYALKVSGDSMDRIVRDRATIIVDPDDKDLFHQRLFVVRGPDGVTFKQYLDGPARLVPCSTNPEHRTISAHDKAFDVVGRVKKVILDPAQAALE